MIPFVLTLIYLGMQSALDIKSRNVNNKISWVMIFAGIALIPAFFLDNPLLIVDWLIGMVVVGLFFWKIKKTWPHMFGSGDFWGILTIQALNPSYPFILMVFPVYLVASLVLFVVSMVYEDELPFFPFLLVGYLIVFGIAFLLGW